MASTEDKVLLNLSKGWPDHSEGQLVGYEGQSKSVPEVQKVLSVSLRPCKRGLRARKRGLSDYSSFYRTLSSIGATTLKRKGKRGAEERETRGKR